MTDYIKGAYEYFSGEGSRDEVAVKALDDKTLQVELKQPTAYFLNLVSWFTYMPCREDMASTGEGWEKDPPNASPTARSCWRSTRWAPTFC